MSSKRHSHLSRKKSKKVWLVFLALIAAVCLFHKTVLLWGCKLALVVLFPERGGQHMHYEQMRWQDDVLCVWGLQVESDAMQLSIDAIELQFGGSFSPLCFRPQLKLIHPQIVMKEETGHKKSPTALGLLLPHRFLQASCEVNSGVLQLSSQARFYFSVDKTEELGRIALSYDPGMPPILSAGLFAKEGKVGVKFQLEDLDCGRLLPLLSLMDSRFPRSWEKVQGEVKLNGEALFNSSLHLSSLKCEGALSHIDFENQSLRTAFSVDELSGTISSDFDSFWDKSFAHVNVHNGSYSRLGKETWTGHVVDGEVHLDQDSLAHVFVRGSLHHNDKECPVIIKGEGTFEEARLQLEGLSEGHLQCALEWKGNEKGERSLAMCFENLTHEYLELFSLDAFGIERLEGNGDGSATLFFTHNQLDKVLLKGCAFQDVHCDIRPANTTIAAEKLNADAYLVREKDAHWKIESLSLSVEDGDVRLAAMSSAINDFHGLKANIRMADGVMQPSQLKGEWGGFKTEVTLLGPQSDVFGEVLVHSPTLPLSAQAKVFRKGANWDVEAEANLFDQKMRGGAQFSLHGAFKEGWVEGKKLTEDSYGFLVSRFDETMKLKGELELYASLLPEKIDLFFAGKEVFFDHPIFAVAIPALGLDEGIHFSYDIASKKWSGEMPVSAATVHCKETNLLLENVEGKFLFADDVIYSPSFYSDCHGLGFRGELSLSPEELTLKSSQVAGELSSLFSIMKHFPNLPEVPSSIEGNFYGDQGAFNLVSHQGDVDWSLKGKIMGVAVALNPSLEITKGKGEILFDSKEKVLKVQKAEGKWDAITVKIPEVRLDLQEEASLQFELFAEEESEQLLRIIGKGKKNKGGPWEMKFDRDATHFLGAKLNVSKLQVDEKLNVRSFEMHPIFDCQHVKAQIEFLDRAGIISPSFPMENLEGWQLEGKVKAHLFTEELSRGFSFKIESTDLKVNGRDYEHFELSGHSIGGKWLIDRWEMDGLFLKGTLATVSDRLNLTGLEGSLHGVLVKGDGFFEFNEQCFYLTLDGIKGDLASLSSLHDHLPKGSFMGTALLRGDFSEEEFQLTGEIRTKVHVQTPTPLAFESVKPLSFSYTAKQGLHLTGVELIAKTPAASAYALLRVKEARKEKEEFLCEALEFSATPDLIYSLAKKGLIPAWIEELKWEGNLEGRGDVTLSPNRCLFQGILKEGLYGTQDHRIGFDVFQIRYENSLWNLRTKMKVGEQTLWGSLQVDATKAPFGALKLYDHPQAEGLKILFKTVNDTLVCEEIQGSCSGVACDFKKSDDRKLSGEMKFDLKLLSQLLSSDLRSKLTELQLGTGYSWQGDVFIGGKDKFHATGMLKGDQFECLGYRLNQMQASCDIDATRIDINHLRIDDHAGQLGVLKLTLQKDERGWDLNIPLFQARDFQPSLLQKQDQAAQKVKPFIIRNCCIKDIHGRLGDWDSLEGSGLLSFTNQFKKGTSFFDFPLEVLRNLGLDIGLLTPIQGEVELELRGDKFYLVGLKNAISEGERSEFYLCPEKGVSYIDLSGKINIDLKLRQDVVLKLAEPFTLSIRGTLEKPRYGLR